jgi:hypothetical protein
VLIQRVQIVVLVLKVPDIAVALPSCQKKKNTTLVACCWGEDRKEPTEEEDIVVAPEGHHDARGLVQCERLDVLERASLPHGHLAIAHAAEPGRRDAIAVAHPHNAGTLDAAVALSDAYGVAAGARVEQAELAVAGRGGEELAGWAERNTLDSVPVSDEDGAGGLRGSNVPELDGVVANGGREDVLSGGVPEYLANLARGRVDAQHGLKVARDPAFCVPVLECGPVHLPDHHVAVLATRRDDRVRVR